MEVTTSVASADADAIIAVASRELSKWGCAYCGYRSGSTPISGNGTVIWDCGDCGRTTIVLAEGVQKSTIGINDFYPELQDHPRRGTPCHGNPDEPPAEGGEHFRARDIGLDYCSCFVCPQADERTLINNIAAFVACKDAGERVVALFVHGAWLDYRENEPDRVQIKVGACDAHLAQLKKLEGLCADGRVTSRRIADARTV